ncbi:MAG TPA: cellulase family glycosylhydrolase [Acidimicrobiia bacterium]|nr:cellulase family glycosylhydrolase [Acidimicrobiia bacterium]
MGVALVTVLVVAAGAAPASAVARSVAASGCLPPGIGLRITPRAPGVLTLDARGLTPTQHIDVLLNTEAGATLLARPTTSPSGTLCGRTLRVPPAFRVHNSTTGLVTVPLHSGGSYEEYQLNVIGEARGDGYSVVLPLEGNTLLHSVEARGLDLDHATHEQPCPPPTTRARAHPAVQTPLTTSGRWIVDATGHRVKLTSVNWYGAEAADFIPGGLNCQSIGTIAREIRADGFNSVRLPWSNAMYEEDPRPCSSATIDQPCVSPGLYLEANPGLRGRGAVGILRAVVAGLGQQGVGVVLDDHTTDAEFCCAPYVFNGLWWGGQIWDDAVGYGPARWQDRQGFFVTDWVDMTRLFASSSNVIGADLRNEPTGAYGHDATWDSTTLGPHCQLSGARDVSTLSNWEEAAQETSDAVLSVDPSWLVFVEGPESSTNLSAVWNGDGGRGLPLTLCANGAPAAQLVYSPHAYQWEVNSTSVGAMTQDIDAHWGRILTPGEPYTAPIWVGEFGGCDTRPACTRITATDCPAVRIRQCTGNFFEYFTQYLAISDVDWSYWAFNGTRSDGGANVGPDPVARANLTERTTWTWFEPSVRGVVDPHWRSDGATRRSGLLARLQCVQPATLGPLAHPASRSSASGCPSLASPTADRQGRARS